MSTYLLLPAYNEEKALPSLLEKVKSLGLKIIIVDDGSTDRTAEIGARYCAVLLRHEKNKGLGEALKTGFNFILQEAADEDLVVTMDADDTHDPRLIEKMMEKANNFDIVVASRYMRGGKQTGVHFLRVLFSWLMNKILRFFFPIAGANDYSSGYRLYKVRILKKLSQIEARGFACMPEILIKLAWQGAKVTEVPLVMHYELKKSGTKFKYLDLIFNYLFLFWMLMKKK